MQMNDRTKVSHKASKLVAWGGYDASKPRVRLLLDALRRCDALAGEIGIDVWSGVEDKSVAGKRRAIRAILTLILGFPRAAFGLARMDRGIDILLPYPGTPDIFIAAVIARLQGRRIVLDAFLPIYDTIVGDRAMVKNGGLLAKLIHFYERLGLRLADVIITDTDSHADFFAKEFGINQEKFITVLVGAEPLFNTVANPEDTDDILSGVEGKQIVLFYGQLIPLHGLSTILEATTLCQNDDVHWVLVGKGQQEAELRTFLERSSGSNHRGKRKDNISWVEWVDYARLPSLIARADLCLGVFGGSDKAGRVIPNKLFQTLAMGKTVITRSSSAVDVLASRYPQSLRTVPANNPLALANAVQSALSDPDSLKGLPAKALSDLTPDAGVKLLLKRLGGG